MKYGSRVGSARVPGPKRTQGCRVAARVAAEPNKQPNKNVLTGSDSCHLGCHDLIRESKSPRKSSARSGRS